MAGRSASAARGQGVKQGSTSTTRIAKRLEVGGDQRGHRKTAFAKTIATRVPRRWGK